jgi:hypothetical protein
MGRFQEDMLVHIVDVLGAENFPHLLNPVSHFLLNLAAHTPAAHARAMRIVHVQQAEAVCTSLWRTFMSRAALFWSK